MRTIQVLIFKNFNIRIHYSLITKIYKSFIHSIYHKFLKLNQLLQTILTKLFPLILLFFLPACGSFGLYKNAYNSAADYINPKPFILTSQIKNLPYAMQLVEHRGKGVIMVLARVDNQKLTWVDGAANEITTLQGKIINSHGLKNDFESLQPPNIFEVFQLLVQLPGSEASRESLIRFLKPETNFLKVKHKFKLAPRGESLFERKIDNKLLEYFILEEKVDIPAINWQYTNIFWLDMQGQVLKSKQFLTPDQPKYFLETLKSFVGSD